MLETLLSRIRGIHALALRPLVLRPVVLSAMEQQEYVNRYGLNIKINSSNPDWYACFIVELLNQLNIRIDTELFMQNIHEFHALLKVGSHPTFLNDKI